MVAAIFWVRDSGGVAAANDVRGGAWSREEYGLMGVD